MKTKIKFMTNDEQFRTVMKILKLDFQEQYTYGQHYFIIHDKENLDTGWGGNVFKDCEYEEINADLFIRTNGSCEENDLVGIDANESCNVQWKSKAKVGDVKNILDKLVKEQCQKLSKEINEAQTFTMCKMENIQLKKKIENLHIALKKKVEKNKLQASEITLLLEQKQELKEVWKMNYNEIKKLKEDEKILLLRIDTQAEENKKNIDEKDAIIKYLEGRLNEK